MVYREVDPDVASEEIDGWSWPDCYGVPLGRTIAKRWPPSSG